MQRLFKPFTKNLVLKRFYSMNQEHAKDLFGMTHTTYFTALDLKKIYFALMMFYHPDKHTAFKQCAEDQSKNINEAYAHLKKSAGTTPMSEEHMEKLLSHIETIYKKWYTEKEYEEFRKQQKAAEEKRRKLYRTLGAITGITLVVGTGTVMIIKNAYEKHLLQQLCDLVQENNVDAITAFLEQHPNLPIAKELLDQGPIALADRLGNHEIFLKLMDFLEQQQPNLTEIKKENYKTYFCDAVHEDNYAMLALLCKNKVEQWYSDKNSAPIFYTYSPCLVRYLKKHGANIETGDKDEQTMLYHAIKNNNPALIKECDTSENREACHHYNRYERPKNAYHILAETPASATLELFLALWRPSDVHLLEKPALGYKYPEEMCSNLHLNTRTLKRIFKLIRTNPDLSNQEIAEQWHAFFKEEELKDSVQNGTATIATLNLLEKNNIAIDYKQLFFQSLGQKNELEVIEHCMLKIKEMPTQSDGSNPWHLLAKKCNTMQEEYAIKLVDTMQPYHGAIHHKDSNNRIPLDILYDQKLKTNHQTCIQLEQLLRSTAQK